jgi:hypothetical protein
MEEIQESKISFRYLRKFNGVMFALHLIQAIIMLVAGLTLQGLKIFNFQSRFPF